ncbi:MAG: type IV secretion system DNA-binding domain-containing protein [Actinobacteria bacterium]|nr:type IV secretion system DNA-binding domain-containing protein [Actinomycetota bacterium]MBI3687384.1 type IV secretion system DNA-binding domain-containing protein [Actinomycetota bacterium]
MIVVPPPPPTPVGHTGPPETPPWWSELLTTLSTWCTHHPYPVVVLPVGLLAGALGRTAVRRHRQRAAHDHAHQVTITPPPEVDPAGAGVLWATLTELLRPSWARRLRDGQPHLAVEYRWAGRQLTISLWVPGTLQTSPIQAAIRGAWPGAATTVTDATPPLPDGGLAVGGALTPILPAWYPLATDHDLDPMRTLIATASGLHTGESACVQILTRPATRRQLRRLRHGVAALRTGTHPTNPLDPTTWLRMGLDLVMEILGPPRHPGTHTRSTTISPALLRADPQRDRDARAAVEVLTGTHWQVAIRYGITHTHPTRGDTDTDTLTRRLVTLAHGLASAFGVWAGRNRLRRLPLPHPTPVLATRQLHHGFLLSGSELASIAALPHDLAVPGLDRSRAKPMPAPVSVPTGGRDTKVLGRAEVGGHAVALAVTDARHHTHILGSTGSGKSTLLLNMILADIHAHRGTIVIDPKGDLVTDLLDRIPPSLADRLVLIDPDQPPGTTLNPLDGEDHHLLVDNVVSIFGAIFAKHWGPRMDDVMRVACLTLLRKADPTLILIPALLQDRKFRHQFTADLDDPEGLRGFWEWYETAPATLRSQVIAPVLSRLRSVLLRDFPRRTFGARTSSFDMRRVLDGGILLARLPKGQIGEEAAKLMGSFVLASAWQAATARIRTPEPHRRDACIYLDEAHNFLNLPGSVQDMLAEARGYHFGMIIAHQNLTQMPRDTQLALSANARNKIIFSCAPEDARPLAMHTLPELDEHDLNHMDAYRAACRLVVAGRETPAFTLHTNPPRPPIGEATAVRRAATPATRTSHGTRPPNATPTGSQPDPTPPRVGTPHQPEGPTTPDQHME